MSRYPDAAFIKSAHQPGQFVADEGAEVAFAGRSNAGKSSALNTLVQRKGFARTGKSPGRTQLINFFDLAAGCRVVDLPGYGYAKVTRSVQAHWRTLMESYFRQRTSLTGLMLVVDIRRGLLDYDRQMLEFAASLTIPAHVLLTKSDKLKRTPAQKALATARRELGEAAGAQLFSAQTGAGAEEAREVMDSWLGLG